MSAEIRHEACQETVNMQRTFLNDPPSLSLIQQRLTVAGLVLVVLFFAGGFSRSVYADSAAGGGYHVEFAFVELSVAVGACLAILAITSLILCEQIQEIEQGLLSRRLFFSASTIWLYLALSQALSAGSTEIVYGIAQSSRIVAAIIGIFATPLWLLLLFGAPLHLILRFKNKQSTFERRALYAAYLMPLLLIFFTTAEIYRVQSKQNWSLLFLLVSQLWQPLTWADPW